MNVKVLFFGCQFSAKESENSLDILKINQLGTTNAALVKIGDYIHIDTGADKYSEAYSASSVPVYHDELTEV